MLDIMTLNYVVEQLKLLNAESVEAKDLKRYVVNLQNNLEVEMGRVEERMFEEMGEV